MKKIYRTFVSAILIIILVLTSMIFARAVEVSTAADFISQINGTATEITITRDLTLTSSVTIKRSVKINGGSNTITLNYSGDDIIFNGSGTIEINGGVWKDDDGQDTFYSNSFTGILKFTNGAKVTGGLPINLGANSAGTVVIDGGVIESTGHAIKNQGSANVQILSGSITVSGKEGSNAYYATGTAKGSLIVGKPDGTGPILTHTNTSTTETLVYLNASVENLNHTIYAGTFTHKGSGKVIYIVKKASVDIKYGTFTANAGQTFNICKNSTVNISGGTFSSASDNLFVIDSDAKVNISGGEFKKGSSSPISCSGSLSITGGIYDFDPSGYLVSGYKSIQSGDKWIVGDSATVVTTFEELRAAINGNASNIFIANDIAYTEKMAIAGKTIIFKGPGKVTFPNNDGMVLTEGSNVTIDGPVFVQPNSLRYDKRALVVWNSYCTIESGGITGYIHNQGRSGSTGGVLTINGGTFTQNNGEDLFENDGVAAVTTINGGTFNNDNSSAPLFHINKGNVTINDGTFNKGISDFIDKGTDSSISINVVGGTYNFDPSSYLSSDYKAVRSGNNWVVEENQEATSVSTYNELLTAISNKAPYIKLTANISLSSAITLNFDTTVDGNGYAFSGKQILVKGTADVTLKNIKSTIDGDTIKVDESPKLTIDGGEIKTTKTSGNWGALFVVATFTGEINVVGDAHLGGSRFAFYNGQGTGNSIGVINLKSCTLENTIGEDVIFLQSGHIVNIGNGDYGEKAILKGTKGDLIRFSTSSCTTRLNIYDGAVLTGNRLINKLSGTLTITGGEFKANSGNPIIFTNGNSAGPLVIDGTSGNLKINSDTVLLKHNSKCTTTITGLAIEQDSTIIEVLTSGGKININGCDLISNKTVINCQNNIAEISLNNNTVINSKETHGITEGIVVGDGTGKVYNKGKEIEPPDYENSEKSSIAMLLKGGDEHRYGFKVNLKPNTTYKFMYVYRATGVIPKLSITGDVDLLSIKDRTVESDNLTQIYHITTDNFNKTNMEYTFEFGFEENTYGVGFYIANMQLYRLHNGKFMTENILSSLNPVNNDAVYDTLVEKGQNLDVELNDNLANKGWFGEFNTNSGAASNYTKYVKITDNFFDATKEENSAKCASLRKVLLGSKEVDVILDYDEHCDNVLNIKDLLRLKKANGSTQTPTLSVGEQLSEIKPADIPNPNFGTVNNYTQDDRYIKLVKNATSSNYNAYLQTLKNNGFIVYGSNEIEGNLFATLINEATTVTVEYIKADSSIFVISEFKGALYSRQKDNVYQSQNVQSLLTGMCLSTAEENGMGHEGMGMVTRLDDGSFIIVDGGFGGNSTKDPDNLLKILTDQSPAGTEKFTIAAWIFTHCHTDHIGNFSSFTYLYRDKINVESFYFNFPTDEGIFYTADYMFDDSLYRYDSFRKNLKDYYPDVPIIRPHAGEKFYIRNAEIEMLFSYENLFPNTLEGGSYGKELNVSSIMFKMHIGGQSVMYTGDSDDGGMNFATEVYGSYLKSDIFQMPHHGMNGLKNYFQKVDPVYAILPYSKSPNNYNRFINASTADAKSKEANQWLIHDSTLLRQMIDVAHGNVVIPLPYNPADSEIYQRIPDLSNYRYKDYSYLY